MSGDIGGISKTVNYNSKINFKEVYSLYKGNVSDLTFYNDLTKDWGKIVQSMISEIDSKYIFIKCLITIGCLINVRAKL